MSDIVLVAEPRQAGGTRAAKRLRTDDHIPGVVYGQGSAPVAVSVARRDLRIALSGPSGLNAVIQLKVGDTVCPTVVKEMQRDPVRRTVRHIDFLVVDLLKNIEVEVPLVLVGESVQVKNLEGIVDAQVSSIKVSTTPRNIPTELSIDISDMAIGDTKHAGQLVMPAGVTLAMDPDAVIVSAEATRATMALQQSTEAPAAG